MKTRVVVVLSFKPQGPSLHLLCPHRDLRRLLRRRLGERRERVRRGRRRHGGDRPDERLARGVGREARAVCQFGRYKTNGLKVMYLQGVETLKR